MNSPSQHDLKYFRRALTEWYPGNGTEWHSFCGKLSVVNYTNGDYELAYQQVATDTAIKQLYIAYDLLTSWLVDMSTDPFAGFEDVDPEIDNIRTIIEEAIDKLTD